MPMPTKVAVIGAGVSGLLTARELNREGHRVTVFEQGDRVGGLWVYDPRTETDLLGMDPNREIVHSSLYKVAVIGAGVSGLLTARELNREGHRVTVFEQGDRVGGLWVYDPRTETDLLGMDPNREIVHSSLYKGLRTNSPRKLMEFLDYPFVVREDGDTREYPCHEEVLAFVENFAKDFGLMELIRFAARVVRVEVVEKGKGWFVEWKNLAASTAEEEVFDAVVVCNGHYTQPLLAEIPGIEKWLGRQIHSHNYRTPEPFLDQIIVVVGNGPSAVDISRELASVAKEIHLASRSPDIKLGKLANRANIWQHPMVIDAQEDGSLLFQDGTSLVVDTILYCTGYKYSFSFDLKTNGYIEVKNNRIHPLYNHIFPPRFAPSLSFIGIPFKLDAPILPSQPLISQSDNFLVKELQAKWLASVLSGKVSLPSEADMTASIENHYLKLKEEGKREHCTHCLFLHEFDYINWIFDQLGLPALDPGIEQTYRSIIKRILSNNAEEYRDC